MAADNRNRTPQRDDNPHRQTPGQGHNRGPNDPHRAVSDPTRRQQSDQQPPRNQNDDIDDVEEMDEDRDDDRNDSILVKR